MAAFVALNVKKARAIGPSPSLVARMKSMLAAALVDDLSPESWSAVARALKYGSTQLVEDLIVGTGESLTRAWGERFVAAVRDAYEHAANTELARVKSGVRIFLSKAAPDRLMERGEAMRAERKPGKTNRFTGVPHSDEFIRRQAASLVVRVSRDQRQAIRESLLARYSKERRPETLVRDLKQTIGLDPRRAKALRNFEDQLRASGSKNVVTQVERYRKELLQNRAETIARTESAVVEGQAKFEAWNIAVDEGAVPVDAEMEWVSSADACGACAFLDGERVPVGDAFPSSIGPALPPLHPNCGCTLVLRSF
ncbi:MAG: hypothetical protein IT381_14870 [Deltaproteobacteria bacterium]|nr:hypothetical protein [Deltaproteobacteria bacterium]